PNARLSVIVEDVAVLDEVPAEVDVFVDVNPGMNRTGIPVADVDLIRGVAAAAGSRFRGVHYYDGHITAGAPAARAQRAFEAYDRLCPVLETLERDGRVIDEVITSGTPTFRAGVDYPRFRSRWRHRVSPGTVVLHDQRSAEEVPELALEPAAFVFTRVISHPAPGIVTTDAGSKSIAAEAGDPCAAVFGHPHLEALAPSEEHLPLRVHRGPPPPRDAELLLVPRHVCPTINLAESVVLVEGGRVVGVEPVAARARDLRCS
ncbi:MAG: D-TA family PLP-dependent enzyme, partial [Phycisphaerae bacterium]|nr:D-TA family PLP-dependent enzyme [Phycisphaerae bacterium]